MTRKEKGERVREGDKGGEGEGGRRRGREKKGESVREGEEGGEGEGGRRRGRG